MKLLQRGTIVLDHHVASDSCNAGKGQATRVILNFDESNVDTGALKTSINSLLNTPGNRMDHIQEIIIKGVSSRQLSLLTDNPNTRSLIWA